MEEAKLVECILGVIRKEIDIITKLPTLVEALDNRTGRVYFLDRNEEK